MSASYATMIDDESALDFLSLSEEKQAEAQIETNNLLGKWKRGAFVSSNSEYDERFMR